MAVNSGLINWQNGKMSRWQNGISIKYRVKSHLCNLIIFLLKHDNHMLKKSNINVIQYFDEIKLYVSPKLLAARKGKVSEEQYNFFSGMPTPLNNRKNKPADQEDDEISSTPHESNEISRSPALNRDY